MYVRTHEKFVYVFSYFSRFRVLEISYSHVQNVPLLQKHRNFPLNLLLFYTPPPLGNLTDFPTQPLLVVLSFVIVGRGGGVDNEKIVRTQGGGGHANAYESVRGGGGVTHKCTYAHTKNLYICFRKMCELSYFSPFRVLEISYSHVQNEIPPFLQKHRNVSLNLLLFYPPPF